MKRLRIYYILDSYDGPQGGTEKQVLMLIRQVHALGHDVRLFVLRHTGYTRSTAHFPCPIESLDVHSIRSLHTLWKMLAFRKRVQMERPDVIHVFFNDASVIAPLFCKRRDNIMITSRRDMGFWYTPSMLLLLRLANYRVDRVICNSQAVANEVARRERIPRDKLLVVYNGLDTGKPADSPTTLIPQPSMEKGREDRIRICMVANMRPIKRQEDFIRAAAEVSRQVPGCEFLIVGEPLEADYHARLLSLMDELDLHEKVRFAGLVRDTPALLAECQIGVLTSESEGLSNAIMEYMATGLPVVCSNVGGNGELVEHGSNGFLYEAGDVTALANHLIHLCLNPGERQRMGHAGLMRAMAFSPAHMVQAHMAAYLNRGFEPAQSGAR